MMAQQWLTQVFKFAILLVKQNDVKVTYILIFSNNCGQNMEIGLLIVRLRRFVNHFYKKQELTHYFSKGYYALRDLTFNDVKVPMIQYFLSNDDYQLIYESYTKIKRKIFIYSTFNIIGGTRKTNN